MHAAVIDEIRGRPRVNAEAEQVDRWLEELRVDPVPAKRRRSIGLDRVPSPSTIDAGGGLNFLVLAADGRIERDYTFVVA